MGKGNVTTPRKLGNDIRVNSKTRYHVTNVRRIMHRKGDDGGDPRASVGHKRACRTPGAGGFYHSVGGRSGAAVLGLPRRRTKAELPAFNGPAPRCAAAASSSSRAAAGRPA